jgi:hypothetical protein
MKRDNQAARRARTIESASGIRIVLEAGATQLQVFDRQLSILYRDIIKPKMLYAQSPFLARFCREDITQEPLTRPVP